MNMFERALYRRASLLNQFGFSENIGYLGHHLNQWVPTPYDEDKLLFVHHVVFEFLLIAVFAGVWLCRKNSGVVLASSMFLLSSVGLVLYLNMADGTRPDSYGVKIWNAQIKELRKLVPDSIPDLPSLSKLNRQFTFYYSIPGNMRKGWLNNAEGANGLRTFFAWDDALEEQGKTMPEPPENVAGKCATGIIFSHRLFCFLP